MTPSFDRDAFFARSLLTMSVAELDDDQRWSTWPETTHTLDRGPQPFPAWVVQHDGAVDTELGVLKTGKEADAFLLERALPDQLRTGAAGEAALLVAKRYRSPEHSSFHRSHQYTEGRRGTDSREARAVAKGTAFGRQVAAAQWARTLREVVLGFAELGLVHGDLSPYNILIDPRGGGAEPVIIDVPQVIDLIANPNGPEFLRRDCRTVCTWLRANGAGDAATDPQEWADAALGTCRTP
ncbi:MAG: phosphotransferase [Brachybacterium sp.]|uniref:RIO1 family regulatory kinase/ATPase domain-containing protein n=1 Tax=Brachybacterium sp. TaxID=1891286 RepID=UPI002647038D|nr:RIO1 family regulatory kinase/ATPase [Brachybacterium sp.]MDN5687191.1 phosphotransferase [Brachybacterium sp.]